MNKIILSLIIMGVLVVGTITTATMVDAAKPEPDPDGDGTLEGIVFEIIGLLKHPIFGLSEIHDDVEHSHDELHNATYGLPIIQLEVEHNHDELHNATYGLPIIQLEVEHNHDELHDSEYGLDAIDNATDRIEGAVFSSTFGLEEIHNDVHETNIEMFKVYVDLRYNYYELTPAGCVLANPIQSTCALLPDDHNYNMWGIKATCPNDDPRCGLMTFTSIKNVDGYNIVNSDDVTINMGLAMAAVPIVGLIIDENYALMAAGSVPTIGFTGLDTNNLYQLNTGVVYGQSVYVHTSPAPYFGVAEFTIYAPTGTTFEQIWDCDGIVTTCSRSTPVAIVNDTPSDDTLDWTEIVT